MKRPLTSPTGKTHTPIVSLNKYAEIDGYHRKEDTDTVALSIGLATYSEDCLDKEEQITTPREISLKVWRHTGKKWSRISEELPIYRNLDLSILFVKSLLINDKDSSLVFRGSHCLHIDKSDLFDRIRKDYSLNKEHYKPRLKELRDVIDLFLKTEEND